MKKTKARVMEAILTAVIVLSFLLTACGKSGGPSAGDGSSDAVGSTNANESEQAASKEKTDPNSPYSIAKAKIDGSVAFIEQECGIDVDAVIDGAYVKYGNAVNKEIVTPEFTKALIPLIAPAGYGSSDPTGINQQSGTRKVRATAALESKGHGNLDLTDAAQNIEAAMIFLSAIAENNNFSADDRGKIYAVYMCDDANRENYSNALNEIYYPSLSKVSK